MLYNSGAKLRHFFLSAKFILLFCARIAKSFLLFCARIAKFSSPKRSFIGAVVSDLQSDTVNY